MKTHKTILLHNTTPEELKNDLLQGLILEIQDILIKTKFEKPVEYLTRQEVAKILKISVVTLAQWDKYGIIQPYRIGNRIRYKSDEIEKALMKINYK